MSRLPKKSERCASMMGCYRCEQAIGHDNEHSHSNGRYTWKDGQAEATRHRQCTKIYAGRGVAIFCLKTEGHAGDHRGGRRQWNEEGKRVLITEPQPI